LRNKRFPFSLTSSYVSRVELIAPHKVWVLLCFNEPFWILLFPNFLRKINEIWMLMLSENKCGLSSYVSGTLFMASSLII
ncbi:hypothetical protein, partial [Legionella sp.]|uniref:hypothetical protein n=1 Tax=Legionella sp. TaxID=459 RepID=UPI003CB9D5C8